MNLKKSLSGLLCSLLITFFARAQHKELSFHLDPHILSATKLDVKSTVVMKKDQFAALGGVSFASFSNKGLGLRAGFNLGFFRPRFEIQPKDGFREIFGPVTMYNSLSIEPVKRFNLVKSEFEVFAGGDVRYFHSNGNSSYGWNYLSTDPTEFTDYNIRVAPYDNKIQTNIYGGLAYIMPLNERHRISISLIKNFGLRELGTGRVSATADDGSVFQSNFNAITNFTGLRVQYGYDVRKNKNPIEPSDGLIRQAIFLEALGSGGLFSLNYDRRLKPGNGGFGARIGLGHGMGYEISADEFRSRVTVPIMINYIFGSRRSGLEAGIGITPEYALNKPLEEKRANAWVNMNLVYRLQPMRKGFMMRAGWTPVIGRNGDLDPYWAGVSIGYSFK